MNTPTARPENEALLPVEQADRDAAARFRPYIGETAAGLHDGSPLVQAFAAHRLTSTPTALPGAEDVALRAEVLSEHLFTMSAQLRASGFLDSTPHHVVYERVVKAFQALDDAILALQRPRASGEVLATFPKYDVCRKCCDGSNAGLKCLECDGKGHVPFKRTPLHRAADEVPANPVGEDFLVQLRRVNGERYAAWTGDGVGDPLYLSNEFGGEAGEVQNIVKKLVREQRGWRGSRATVGQLGDEIADGIICLDNLARGYGIDLADAVARKFNQTSAANDFPQRLAALKSADAASSQEQGACRVCSKSIASAELCAECAKGNDPFVTSKYSEGR